MNKNINKSTNLDKALRIIQKEICTISQQTELNGADAHKLIQLAEAYLQIQYVIGKDGSWHRVHHR